MLRHEIPVRGVKILEKVKSFKLLICGAGAIGSNLALTLSKQGFESITVLDKDRVEPHNIGTQVYGPDNEGQLKTQALSQIVFESSGVVIEQHARELKEPNSRYLNGHDLIVDAFDNSKSRRMLFECGREVLHCGFNGPYSEIRWNSRYVVPSDHGEDICEYPLARNLVTLTVSILAEVIIEFISTGNRINKSVTFKDLKIHTD